MGVHLLYRKPPDPGIVPDWPETGIDHAWIHRGMGIWHCNRCLTQVQVLPSGLLVSCKKCRKAYGGVHQGPRGWWHVSNGTVSEFVRTRAEANARFDALARTGAMSQPTPPPPLFGCLPRTTCSAVILGVWGDYECGHPVVGETKDGLLVCDYHLSHPYAELIENMPDWSEPDRSSFPVLK